MIFVYLISCVDAKGRGFGGRFRTSRKIFYKNKINLLSISNVESSGDSSNESSSNPLKLILGIVAISYCIV